jgi:hypothetical protein
VNDAKLTDEQMDALREDYRAGSTFLLRWYDAPETKLFKAISN